MHQYATALISALGMAAAAAAGYAAAVADERAAGGSRIAAARVDRERPRERLPL